MCYCFPFTAAFFSNLLDHPIPRRKKKEEKRLTGNSKTRNHQHFSYISRLQKVSPVFNVFALRARRALILVALFTHPLVSADETQKKSLWGVKTNDQHPLN